MQLSRLASLTTPLRLGCGPPTTHLHRARKGYTAGRLVATFDRASASFTQFDGRGRVVRVATRVAQPQAHLGGSGLTGFINRYAPRYYEREFQFDAANREVFATTGATTDELTVPSGGDHESAVYTQYTRRGTVKSVASSYNSGQPLIAEIHRTADGLLTKVVYGDLAGTTTANTFDDRRRLRNVITYRGPPEEWSSQPAGYIPAPSTNPESNSNTYQYDWLGNTSHTGDDAGGFYDRSLGDITNGSDKPYQLKSATGNDAVRGGALEARYDAAGNLTQLDVFRQGPCLGASDCSQRYLYQWDEVGRLTRARRWDVTIAEQGTELNTSQPPAADLQYLYDAGDQRVLKQATDAAGETSHTAYVFETLELRRATFSGDYELSEWTEVPYLFANGVQLARVAWHDPGEVPAVGDPAEVPLDSPERGRHVLLELGDHLGSTSVVLDHATGELVERSTFYAYGGTESDYRPDRWKNFREDYRFTGKEEDVEVGLTYFGKRYLNAQLGRWVSADPLGVHSGGLEADLNVYAYVRAGVLMNVDPVGLDIDIQKAIRDGVVNLAPWAVITPATKALKAASKGDVAGAASNYAEAAWNATPAVVCARGWANAFATGPKVVRAVSGDEQAQQELATDTVTRATGAGIALATGGPSGGSPSPALVTPEGAVVAMTGDAAISIGASAPGVAVVAMSGGDSDGDGSGKPEKAEAKPESAPAPPEAKKPGHQASFRILRPDGSVPTVGNAVSGNMDAAEKATRSPRISDTEARIVRTNPLNPGETLEIEGNNRPCPTCQGKMRKASGTVPDTTISYTYTDEAGNQVAYKYQGGKRISPAPTQ